MKNIMKYKDFIGSVQYSTDDNIFFGRIEGVNDLVTFEGKSVDELKRAFEESVDDYLELCKTNSKELGKSYKGTFNIRINPELHRMAARQSIELGLSLNQFVEKAISELLQVRNPIQSHKA